MGGARRREEGRVRRRSTWSAPAGLGDGESLMRGAAVTAALPGEDGRLSQSLRGKGKGCQLESLAPASYRTYIIFQDVKFVMVNKS